MNKSRKPDVGAKAAEPEPDVPPAPAPGLDADTHARGQKSAAKAETIRNGRLFATYAQMVIGIGKFDLDDIQTYIDTLVDDLKATGDPLRRILIEQMALVHFRLAHLNAHSMDAKSTESLKVYNAGCGRLLAELRRLAFTIDSLGSKTPSAVRLKLAKTG